MDSRTRTLKHLQSALILLACSTAAGTANAQNVATSDVEYAVSTSQQPEPDPVLQDSNVGVLNPSIKSNSSFGYMYPVSGRLYLQANTNPLTNIEYWRFEFVSSPNGVSYYVIRNIGANLCLDVVGQSMADGALLTLSACDVTSASQWWRWGNSYASPQIRHLTNYRSGKCLDAPINYPVMEWNGAPMDQYNCGGASSLNQLWKFSPIGGP